MLGSEKTAEAWKKTKTDPEQQAAAPGPPGRLTAMTAIEAVNATERLLCGDGAVHAAAVAEGLALTGRAAATLLDAERDPRDDEPTAAQPWVHHRILGSGIAGADAAAFELVAGDAQEAVDQCLVARRLSSELRLPGVCSLDAEVASILAFVRLPGSKAIAAAAQDAAVGPDSPSNPGALAPEVVLAAAGKAFTEISERVGRGCEAISTHRMEDARVVLIAEAGSGQRAIAVAEALRAAGVRCGVVSIALVRPFPVEQLLGLVGGVDAAAVFQPGDLVRRPGLFATVRAVLQGEPGISVHRIRLGGDGELTLSSDVREAFGLSPDTELQAALRGATPETADKRLALGFVPGGPFGERLLLEVAALLGNLGELDLARPAEDPRRLSTLVVGRAPLGDTAIDRLDLLFVAHPSIPGSLGGTAELERLDEKSSLVFYTADEAPEWVWRSLTNEQRAVIEQRGPRVHWLSAEAAGRDPEVDPGALRRVIQGAVLSAIPGVDRIVEAEGDPVEALCRMDPTFEETASLRVGAQALQPFEIEELDAARLGGERDFREDVELPVVPRETEEVSDETRSAWRQAVRHFHLTGEGAGSAAEPLEAVPLRPAVLAAIAEECAAWRQYPLALLEGETGTEKVPLREILTRALERLAADGPPAAILERQLPAIVRAANRVLEGRLGLVPIPELFDELFDRLTDSIDVSEAGAAEVSREIERLRSYLPSSGSLLGLDDRTLMTLFVETVREGRRPKRQAFRVDVKILVDRLTGLLQLDDSRAPQGRTPDSLSSTLAVGNEFLDPEALARNLPEHRGSKRMDPIRRRRVEATLARLHDYLEQGSDQPELFVVRATPPVAGEDPEGCRVLYHTGGLEAAIGLFDGLAESMVETIRAVRTARLEADDSYDPDLHDEMIARTGWRSFTTEEMLLLPPVVVFETGRRLRGTSLASFSVLLRSGRPVYVLVSERTSELQAGETWEALAGYHPGLGYLAVAHREPVVLQSTLARPGHLIAGLEQIATVLQPAVALVAVPSWQAPVRPWLQLVAAQQSRTTPCFRYDPLAGETWAERFDLEANTKPEQEWPTYEVAYRDESGGESSREESFTFAHAAAIDPAYRPHFRVLPRDAWSDDQMEMAEYLAAPRQEQRRRVPFVWVLDEKGRLARAVTTRELAFACRDRRRAWRILQELAGLRNEYARRAAEKAREEVGAEAQEARRRLEAAHAEELEKVRADAAGEAMERLAAVLLDLDAAPAPAARPALAVPAAPDAAEPVTKEAEAVEQEEEEEISFNEPYIDSMLCTTCNECTNLNSKMFEYNENRQAVIADAAAGTFEQLVKAAEKCPARCIHPGVPRPDDATATEELVARAKPFN
jgi:ferredoxin